MKASFILVIGEDGALLYDPQQGDGFFASHPLDTATHAMATRLLARPKTPVTLLADLRALDFRRDAIPSVAFTDRKKLVARRLQQTFPRAEITASLLQDKNTALLAAVGDTQKLRLWQHWLQALPNPAGAVHALPLESATLAAALLGEKTETAWTLLTSWSLTGGFRQIVTQRGAFIMTRQTPSPPVGTEPDEIVAIVMREIKATRDYLARQGLRDEKDMRLVVVLPEIFHTAMHAASGSSLLCLSPAQAAQKLGFPCPVDEESCDRLHAGWLAKRRTPVLALMTPDQKQDRHQAHIARWGWRIALTVSLVAALALAYQSAHAWQSWQTVGRAQAQLASLRHDIDRFRAEADPALRPLAAIRHSRELRERVVTAEPLPWTLFETVRPRLFGKFRLSGLSWRLHGETPREESLDLTILSAAAPEETPLDLARDFENWARDLSKGMPDYALSIEKPFLDLQDKTSFDSAKASSFSSTARLRLTRQHVGKAP